MSKAIKLIMADDHDMVRSSLLNELREDPAILVIGEAENGNKLLELMKTRQPDIVLLDVEMPGMDGYETIAILKEKYPEVKVIMLSGHFNNFMVNYFLHKGAGSYLPKSCDINVLLEAIHCVYNKGVYLKTLNMLTKQNEFAFTGKEMEVLKLICVGKTNKEVSTELGIKLNTVDFHKKNIYHKAQVKNASELTLFAVRAGLVCVHNRIFIDKN